MFKPINEKEYAANSELTIAKSGEKHKAEKAYFTGIAKLARALYLDTDGIPCYYLMQLGGGYVENEKFRNAIHVKENARAIVTTQAATKVYKCMNELPSYQRNEIELEENSVLEFVTDNVILYKDAMFRQDTTIRLRDTSTLMYTEGLTSGWSPDGKRFQYSSVQMKLRMFLNDKPIMLDNLKLDTRVDQMDSLGFFEEYSNYSSLIVIDSLVDAKLIDTLRGKIKDLKLDIKAGITKLECNGFVLRVLGNLTQDLEKAIFACINYIRKEKFGSNELELGKR
ncbi:urease accessory protein UreD [uncultured Clostridium sp.]|jgi:urease accessory protein|uniref:urease accessory protein UreD n=1 Tax=uncultured Clostridium sp. TaxID=59620 RepID=UPI002618BC80|nr:urease accessory protein UreD [uncultured Clostridium sp.]